MKYLGQPMRRKIDPRLLQGQGQYIADIRLPGMLTAAFLRSPHAHARVRHIDVARARALPGVRAVFGPDDCSHLPDLPELFGHPSLKAVTQHPLSREVCHVGEPVAMVVADSRYIAEDALELIQVEWEPLLAVAHVEEAVKEGAALAHRRLDSNIAAHFEQAYGDATAAMTQASVVVRQRFDIGRVSCLPIETRGLAAEWKNADGELGLVVYAATQSQHEMRNILARSFDISEQRVRVICPNVGGAFGAKAVFYVEDLLVVFAAREVNAPVAWVEDRIEHMMSSIHEREQVHEAAIGLDRDGRIVAVKDKLLANTGAYVPWGIIVPLITSTLIPGPYKVPNYHCDVTVLYTNTVPLAPYRGAGRPQAALIMNRLLDEAADKLGMDPAEIRRRNLIHEDEFPYTTGLVGRDGSAQVYDSGNYPKLLDELLKLGHYDEWRSKQAEMRKDGRLIGIGMAVAIETTGYGSYEGATVRVEPGNHVTVLTSAASQGQGHETSLAQVAAEVLDIPVEQVTVRGGDTGLISYGTGTFASRIATVGGTAVYKAACGVKDKALVIAGHRFGVSTDELEWAGGDVSVKGRPELRMSLMDILADAKGIPGATFGLPVPPGLEVTEYFTPSGQAITGLGDLVVVEVDRDTCEIKILNYACMHDCGVMLNPLIVNGQIRGGIANGLGTALYEEVIYDDNGQLLTSTLMDYLVPTACEVPDVDLGHLETPSPLNPLGIKGAGESGAIPVPASIQSAVQDAVRSLGVTVSTIPVKPNRLRQAVNHLV